MVLRFDLLTKEKGYLLLILCLYVSINLPFLTVFPPIDNVGDESWMTNISEEFLRSGRPVASMHVGTPLSETPQVTTAWIYNGTLSGVFYILGTSVWAGRFLSFLCGLFVVILTYFFGKRIGNHEIGLIASFLLTTSTVFSWHSREIRPDMMLLAFSTLSVYLFYLAWQDKKDIFLFLSGLISTISVEVHPNGTFFAFAILIIYPVLYRKRVFSKSSFLLLLGLFVGFTIWMVCNYLPYSSVAFETVHKKYLPPIINKNIDTLFIESIEKFLWVLSPQYLSWLKSKYFSNINIGFAYFAILLILLSVIFAPKRDQLMFLISMIILPLGISTFLTGAWNWFHNSVFLVISFVLFSLSIYVVGEKLSFKKFKTLFIYSIVFLYGTVGIMDIMKKNFDMMKYDFNKVKEISLYLPKGATVMGSGIYYFAFREREDIRFISYLFIEEQCPDFKSAIKKYKVDFILVDEIFINLSAMWCSKEYANKAIEYIFKNTSPFNIVNIDYPNSHTANRILHNVYIAKVN